jgi:hypothetical protein
MTIPVPCSSCAAVAARLGPIEDVIRAAYRAEGISPPAELGPGSRVDAGLAPAAPAPSWRQRAAELGWQHAGGAA